MNKDPWQPLSGFRDLTNPTKDWVIAQLREVFRSYGYQYLETPSLERQELLLGKMGDEAQKLLYLFEDNGGRKVGLRYDLTVSLSRFVAANLGELVFPFRRYEIGNVWRAERAQRGRLRQFTQADVDIIGDDNSLESEKELLRITKDVQDRLGVEWLCLVNDRRVVGEILSALKISPGDQKQLLVTLDKKDKLSQEELEAELRKAGLSDIQLRQVRSVFLLDDNHLDQAKGVLDDQEVLSRVEELLSFAQSIGLNASFAPFMVRGLDYYTGTIMECVSADYPNSLMGGGRYDSLIEGLTGEKVPSIGISFGVDRFADYLADKTIQEKALFVINLPETNDEASAWIEQLRRGGCRVEQYLNPEIELGKQIKYASKRGYRKILIPFENEWRRGEIVEKDLETGKQASQPRSSYCS